MNDPKLMILGMGMVGRSLLHILLENRMFSLDDILVTDKSRKAFNYFRDLGGRKENFIHSEVDSKCYREVLDRLESGDYLISLSVGCDCLVLARECSERSIHFICTADDTFHDTGFREPFRYRTHHYQYKELIEKTKGCATSILQFGMNPGLISILTKKALLDIVENDDSDFVAYNRGRLRKLAEAGEYPLLAKELQVISFIESDLDTTQTCMKEDENTVYSTWSADDFYAEMNDRSIQKLGSLTSLEDHLKRMGVSPDQIFYYNKYDGTLVLDASGKDVMTEGYTVNGVFTGCVDVHEEVFSIHDYYTARNDAGEIDYAPSVIFVYRPSDLALSSAHNKDIFRMRLIKKDRMLSGGETVGITVEGANFHPFYTGVELLYDSDRLETPTVLEVSASVYAAIRYISNHPDMGIMYPEHLDVDEILSYTGQYLPVVSKRI